MKSLILVGGGGHCKSVIDVAESCGHKITAIFDPSKNKSDDLYSYNCITSDEKIINYVIDNEFIISVGSIENNHNRVRLHNFISDVGGKFAVLQASSSIVSKYSQLGEGTVVFHNALVNANSIVGKSCIINSSAIVEHDAIIGDFTHISTGAIVNGNVTIGKNCFVGSGAIIKQGVKICDNVIIGAGTLVLSDISEAGTYIGVPAKKIDNA